MSEDSKTQTHLEGLELDNDKVSAPENVASNEPQFRSFYQNMALLHRERAMQFSKIQGQYFLNRPRDAKKLRELGVEWMSNINNGHSRSIVNKYFSAEFNLIHSVSSPVHVEIRLFAKSGAPNGAEIDSRIGRAMSKAWKEVYPMWEDFYVNLDSMRLDRILYGTGILIREFDGGDLSWKFRSIAPDQFMCPLSTQTRGKSLSKFCVVHSMNAMDLWKLYEDDSPYWDKKALGYVLWRASQKTGVGNNNSESTWQPAVLEMQRKIRNYSAVFEDWYKDDIKLVSVYLKEYDGSWSHGIIHESIKTEKPLFFRPSQYDSTDEFCQIWLFEPGQKEMHSVRGLGYTIFQPVEVQNRLDNVLIDQAHLASTIFVRTRAGRGKDSKSVQLKLGTINDLGEAELVQQLAAGSLQASISVNQYQAGILERNSQFEQFDIDNPDMKGRTLGEVGMLATQDSVVSKPQVNFFYRQYDKFFRDTFKLMYTKKKDDVFKEWKERVMFELSDLIIPDGGLDILFKADKGELPKGMTVSATRSTSSGSQVADIMATNRMMQLTPFMTTDRRHVFLRRATAAYSDHTDADLFFPDSDRPDIFTEPMQKATIENAVLILGNEIPVSPNDSHRDECPVHFAKCLEVIQMWSQSQMTAITAAGQLEQLYPHALGHFIALSQDPWSKAIFDGLGAQRGQIENQFRLIAANAQAEQKAEQAAEERKRLEAAQLELQNDPKRLKVVLDAEREDRVLAEKVKRETIASNLQNTKFIVKNDLENTLAVKDFALEQARKNAETVAKVEDAKNSN